jgi:RNA-binding protein YhbY
MKTLREYIDQLDEISRRDFLKGAGATAGLAAIGDPKDAKADWNIIHHDDLLTNKRSVQGFSNSSVENPNVELVLNQWPSVGVVAALSPVPLPLGQRGEGKIGGIVVAYSPFRILIGNQLINDLKGAVFAETQGTGMILAVKNGLNSELIPIIANSLTNQETIKVEISQARKVFTFRGKKNFEEEVDEAATPDAVARIEELIKYK